MLWEGRKRLRGRIAVLLALAVGAVLMFCSLNIGFIIGSEWFGNNASFPWHMNNYIVIEAQYAYSYFGLAALAIGGLATGIAMAAFFTYIKSKKHRLALITSFFVAIILSGLGFNTLDFMLGSFYWTNMAYPPPVQIAFLGSIDVWNYYFFFFVAPLWLGGLLIGIAMSYSAFIYQPKQSAVTIAMKRNLKLPGLIMQETTEPREYIAESRVFSRTRRIIKQTIDKN